MTHRPPDVAVAPTDVPRADEVLTDEALAFVAQLHRSFNQRRLELLEARRERQARLDSGELPDFPAGTASVRASSWEVAPTPDDLQDRRVEITGPAEPKMMINALNSGAKVFMADLEDALSPTWRNVVGGQVALRDVVRRELTFDSPDGKAYRLNESIATLLVRPRGWHLTDAHVQVDGDDVSASLLDFGLYFFHNAAERLARGTAPYFYLPKLESHLEARLWNDVFVFAQDALGLPQGSVRATVLIETILAAFEMDEILYELRDHASGLNAGRWDYIFSIIKKLHDRSEFVLPDRSQVTMAVPFMRAYTQLLVQTCHRRAAHAIGGMSAFIPNRREPEVTANALEQVRIDKEREAGDGFDGTWVAHPDLVPVAGAVFDQVLGQRPNQKERMRPDVSVTASDLLSVQIPGGQITEAGVRLNVGVALQYVASWLDGNGAAAINNLMEDAATAEISRSQLWQWLHHAVSLSDGRQMIRALYSSVRSAELSRLESAYPAFRWTDAAAILDALVLDDSFQPFLTLLAYPYLD
jgi:malate synthase